MSEKYMLFPMSVVDLAAEINKAVDDYRARRISNTELQDVVLAWAQNVPDKLFDGDDYRLSIKKLVGVRRMKVVNKMLDGYQTHIRGVN